MKICVVTSQYGNFWSGLGTYATHLIRGLHTAGHEVVVLCPGVERDVAHPGLRFIDSRRVTVKPTMSNWILLARQVAEVIEKLLAREAFDVVHFADAREALFCHASTTLVSGMMNDYYFVEAPRSPLAYRKYYSDWLVRWAFYNVSRVFERIAIRRLQLVLANTDYVNRSLVEHYGARAERIHTVRYGLGEQATTPAGPRLDGSPSILFVGSNFERKGLPVLMTAMARVIERYPDAMLHVVGHDPKLPVMQRTADSLGIGSNVRFHGGLENSKVQALYGAADLFAMPSVIEGFGLVFLEAMAAGTPVIGGLCGGTPELIEDGENGFVVPPNDAALLSNAIVRLHADPALRDRFARAGRDTYARHTIERMTTETIALFERFKPAR